MPKPPPARALRNAKCRICQHPEVHRIEMARLAGCSLDAVVEAFNLGAGGRDALWRHMRDHVSEDDKAQYLADVPIQELAKRAADEGLSVLDYAALVRKTLIEQMLLASSVNDGHRVAALAGRVTDLLRFQGTLTGELQRVASVVNNTTFNMVSFAASPLFANLQEMLLRTLGPYPDALRAVVTGLEELEASATKDEPRSPPTPPGIDLKRIGGGSYAAA